MKTTVSAIALMAFFAVSPASATDLKGQRDDTSADYVSGRLAFQGLGVGVHVGGQFTNLDITKGGFTFDGIGADGLVGGAHAEYLFAAGSFRVGPYVEGGLANVNTDLNGMDVINLDHYYGGGVKAGYVAWNSTLLYLKGGYQWSSWSIFEDKADADVGSVVLGGGIETMVSGNVSLGLEADYITPIDIEAEGKDISDLLEESESLRVVVRATWRQ